MEFAPEAQKKTGINFASFNQDYTKFTIATKRGWSVNTADTGIESYCSQRTGDGTSLVIASHNLLVTVGSGENSSSQRKLTLQTLVPNEIICNLSFLTAILSVKVNQKCLVVVLETQIHVHSLPNLEVLKVIDTPPNPKGICALSSDEISILAYPGNEKEDIPGYVTLYNCSKKPFRLGTLKAHQNSIASLAIDPSGAYLATASISGTIIRIFNTNTLKQRCDFRRGSYTAAISALNFSFNSEFLCVSSDKPTIHIFKIGAENLTEPKQAAAYYFGLFSPNMDPDRSFSTAKLPEMIGRNIAALSADNTRVYVINESGKYLIYKFDKSTGGDCGSPLHDSFLVLPPSTDDSVFGH